MINFTYELKILSIFSCIFLTLHLGLSFILVQNINSHLKKIFYLFIWLYLVLVTACGIFSCSIWDPVPWPGVEPGAPALGVQSLSPWTTREVPIAVLIFKNHYPKTPISIIVDYRQSIFVQLCICACVYKYVWKRVYVCVSCVFF